MATCLEEGKLWIQNSWTLLNNWPCVASCACGGVGIYVFGVLPFSKQNDRAQIKNYKW